MKRISFWLVVFCLFSLLTGCSSNALRWTPDYHTVRSGETLYSIAHRYGLDYRQLAQWNGLGDGSVIREGQRLRLSGSANASSQSAANQTKRSQPTVITPAPAWRWPTGGQIYLRFGESQKTESGIRVAGRNGQPVVAAAGGEVVYAGSDLASYGNLLIIKHNESWLTAYGFNSALLVKEGQSVGAGQQVARMGQDPAGRALLHFEIRRNGQPVDPMRYLPAR